MKNLTTAIYGKFSGSAIWTNVAGRIFKGMEPEDNNTYPYLIFKIVTGDGETEDVFNGEKDDYLVQFSLFSDDLQSSNEIETMYTNLIALFDNCSLSPTNRRVVNFRRTVTVPDTEEHTTPSGTQQVWHYAVDYSVLVETTA